MLKGQSHCLGGSGGRTGPSRAAYNDRRVFEANIWRLVVNRWDGQRRHVEWLCGGRDSSVVVVVVR
jgi:hypothetical protein